MKHYLVVVRVFGPSTIIQPLDACHSILMLLPYYIQQVVFVLFTT